MHANFFFRYAAESNILTTISRNPSKQAHLAYVRTMIDAAVHNGHYSVKIPGGIEREAAELLRYARYTVTDDVIAWEVP